MDQLQLFVILNAHTSALNPSSSCFPYTSWLAVCKRKGKSSLTAQQMGGWDICSVHCVYNTSLSRSHCLPPASIPSTLGLNTLHCIPHVDCWEKLSTALRSRAIIWLPQRGVVAICMSAWCLHVCPWVGCHPLPSPLNWLAWQRR